MAKGVGIMIAEKVPPPDKLGKGMPEPDADEMGGPSDQDGDDEAAELSAMEAFTKAETTEEKLAAFKDLIAICKPSAY